VDSLRKDKDEADDKDQAGKYDGKVHFYSTFAQIKEWQYQKPPAKLH
jgi:hypothetical protein